MSEPKEYTLKYPFKDVTGNSVRTVKMRRLTAGDLMQLDDTDSDMVQMVKTIGRLTGMDPYEEIAKLDITDFSELQSRLEKQKGKTQTGK